jgi:hypothetical protein
LGVVWDTRVGDCRLFGSLKTARQGHVWAFLRVDLWNAFTVESVLVQSRLRSRGKAVMPKIKFQSEPFVLQPQAAE